MFDIVPDVNAGGEAELESHNIAGECARQQLQLQIG
jgi:hypothetical protein